MSNRLLAALSSKKGALILSDENPFPLNYIKQSEWFSMLLRIATTRCSGHRWNSKLHFYSPEYSPLAWEMQSLKVFVPKLLSWAETHLFSKENRVLFCTNLNFHCMWKFDLILSVILVQFSRLIFPFQAVLSSSPDTVYGSRTTRVCK